MARARQGRVSSVEGGRAGYPGRGDRGLSQASEHEATVPHEDMRTTAPRPLTLVLKRADLALTRMSPASRDSGRAVLWVAALRRPRPVASPPLCPAALLRFRGGGDGPQLLCPPWGCAAGAPAQIVTACPQPEVQGLGSRGIDCKTFGSAPEARMKTL